MTVFQQLVLGCPLGTAVSAGAISLVLRFEKRGWLARRNAELHHAQNGPVSRLGGLGLAAGCVAVLVLFSVFQGRQLQPGAMCWKVLLVALAMFGLGFRDDLSPLGARRKLAGQLVIASAACLLGIEIHRLQIPFTGHIVDLGAWSWLVTVGWLVAMTNLVNLIDGVDGLAGGIGLMLMLLLAYVGAREGAVGFVSAGMAGALIGFLWFNFPPARIYMGDGGAYFLGSLIGSLTIVSSQKGTVLAALTAPLFVLALPILDTTLAILRRGLRGLPLFRPDRHHIHHHLLRSGLSRRQAVLTLYSFTAFFLSLGFVLFWLRGHYLPTLAGLGMLAILLVARRLKFAREWFAVGRVVGNSLAMRAEVQYALAQTRWLVLEGSRCDSLESLSEDTVFIARKLGYARVRIRLENAERTWDLQPLADEAVFRFQHPLPGHPDCFLEVRGPDDASGVSPGFVNEKSFAILSEVLAEGWTKSIDAWEKHHRRPVRFNGLELPPSATRPRKIPAMQIAGT